MILKQLHGKCGRTRIQPALAVATKTHVLNVLHRLTDGGGTAAIIAAPQALVLRQEPRADIERYDALRDREVRHAS